MVLGLTTASIDRGAVANSYMRLTRELNARHVPNRVRLGERTGGVTGCQRGSTRSVDNPSL